MKYMRGYQQVVFATLTFLSEAQKLSSFALGQGKLRLLADDKTSDEGMELLRFWPLALVALCLLACCIPCIGCCICNHVQVSNKRALYDKASDVAVTPLGKIEYSIKGKAPFMLCLHGTPGCHDGIVCDFDKWLDQGFGVIAPSRPNYGRSKLDSGSNKYWDQADGIAALLDSLNVDKVGVYAYSGGGPCAINFAARHKDKTTCLILEAANSGDWDDPRAKKMLTFSMKAISKSIFTARFIGWLAKKNPLTFIKDMMMPGLSTYNAQEREVQIAQIKENIPPEKIAKAAEDFAEAAWVFPLYPECWESYEREMLDCWKDPCPFEDVECPTHISHGDRDGDPRRHADNSHAGIKGSKLRILEGAWHMVDFHPEGADLFREQVEFAKTNTPN